MCAGNCNDPFVTYLNSIGFNAIRLPRANFKPLQILSKEGKDLTWLGDVSDVFVPGPDTRLPAVQANEPAGEFSGRRSGQLKVGLGVSLLGSIIGAMGGSKLGLDVAYKQANNITFEFSNVSIDSVAPAQLDKFLGGSDVNPTSVSVGKLLDADAVYVVTRVVKSAKFIVEGTNSRGTGVTLSVPAIQGAVQGDVKVSAEDAASTRVSYQGKTPLAFGFQAVQLYYENGAYTAFKPLEAGHVAARAFPEKTEDGTDLLNMGGGLVRLSGF
ncbi:MAG: hypothetical protein JWO38_5554 [Gemmataceae bacterium]|nr:hypothetical protein [Gemmataceae bacterium]